MVFWCRSSTFYLIIFPNQPSKQDIFTFNCFFLLSPFSFKGYWPSDMFEFIFLVLWTFHVHKHLLSKLTFKKKPHTLLHSSTFVQAMNMHITADNALLLHNAPYRMNIWTSPWDVLILEICVHIQLKEFMKLSYFINICATNEIISFYIFQTFNKHFFLIEFFCLFIITTDLVLKTSYIH